MARPLVSDDLCTIIESLPPPERSKPECGGSRVPDRAALTGILFVLRSGLPWEMLPQEMDCGSGMTCWRGLREWQDGGVWDRLHRVLLDRLGRAGAIDWCRVCLDSASVSAKRGREDWPEPDGPRPPRIEAADHHRRSGCAGCRQPHRCKRSQQPRLRGADRCLAARSGEGGDDPACARPSSMRTRPMTSHAAAEPYAGGTSELGLPDAAWTAANARHYGANSPNMVIE